MEGGVGIVLLLTADDASGTHAHNATLTHLLSTSPPLFAARGWGAQARGADGTRNAVAVPGGSGVGWGG